MLLWSFCCTTIFDALLSFAALLTSAAFSASDGGTGGIGSEICLSLAAAGFDVAIHYHSNSNRAHELAEEIKKRMKKKVNKNYVSDDLNNNKAVISSEELNSKKNIKDTVKKQLLPYLKEIQNLIIQREKYVEKINTIDVNLDEVKDSIQSIKQSYENNIRELQENINFFDESIEVINNVKGDD